MPVTMTVRNVPDDIAEKLKERAKRNHRSLQGELMAILESASDASPRRLTPREVYENAKRLGISTGGDSTQLIREMRDARYGG